jgi:CRP-like cAMP-binding protein
MDLTGTSAAGEAPADFPGKERIFSRSPLADLAPESRRALFALGTIERFPRRHEIASQGEAPRSFVLIGSGRVKLERARGALGGDEGAAPRSLRADAHVLPLGHRGPGEMVGETALGGAAAATESAMVVDDVEALAIPIGALRRQLASDAALRAAFAAAIVAQHRAAQRRLEGLLLHGVESRLAAFLLQAGERWGAQLAGAETRITAPFTHVEIAALIGSTRETVTLVLGKLKREGLVAFDRRRVILRDRAELEARAARA